MMVRGALFVLMYALLAIVRLAYPLEPLGLAALIVLIAGAGAALVAGALARTFGVHAAAGWLAVGLLCAEALAQLAGRFHKAAAEPALVAADQRHVSQDASPQVRRELAFDVSP